MRVKTKFNTQIDELPLGIISVTLVNDDNEEMYLRVVKLQLTGGEVETLTMNLFVDSLTIEDYRELYFLRWKVEVTYGALKHILQLENF
jgi:hypothetical protein